MEREEILQKMDGVLKDVLKHSNYVLNDNLKAADVEGWDSLSHMIIIGQIENDFGIRFKLKELNKLQDMGGLITLIQSKL